MSMSSSVVVTSGPHSLISVYVPDGRVDHGGRGPRLAGDADEVVEDRLRRQLLDDSRPRSPARQPRRDDGYVEELERARDVDALAAGERQHLTRAVAIADLEHGHRERAVERRVDRDGDDHVTSSQRFSAVRRRTTQPCPRPPGSETVRCRDEVRRGDQPITLPDLDPPQPLPSRTGSATDVGSDDSLESGTPRSHGTHESSAEPRAPHAARPYPCRRLGVGAARVDHLDAPVPVEPELEQLSQRVVSSGARLAPEHCPIDGCTAPSRGARLRPAGSHGVTGLPADERRPARKKVVGRRKLRPPGSETTSGRARRGWRGLRGRSGRAMSRRARSRRARARRARAGSRSVVSPRPSSSALAFISETNRGSSRRPT